MCYKLIAESFYLVKLQTRHADETNEFYQISLYSRIFRFIREVFFSERFSRVT